MHASAQAVQAHSDDFAKLFERIPPPEGVTLLLKIGQCLRHGCVNQQFVQALHPELLELMEPDQKLHGICKFFEPAGTESGWLAAAFKGVQKTTFHYLVEDLQFKLKIECTQHLRAGSSTPPISSFTLVLQPQNPEDLTSPIIRSWNIDLIA